jgi:hypothetical protein
MRAGDIRSVSREIAADTETVYDLVTDVVRTGEWSPECRGARWLDGATGPAVGARFRGRNRWGLTAWTRTCVVEEAEPGKRFAFHTVPRPGLPDSTRWSYTFEPSAAGALVTESYEILRAMPRWVQASAMRLVLPHHQDMRPHMATTLARLAAVAETPAGLLPGQEAAPPGPVDLIGMYVMHHAFRRDLRRFVAAARATPTGDRATWTALHGRWLRFAGALHKHHAAEDAGLWPVLRERVAAAGDDAGVATLDAMAAEHAQIDPLLDACAEGFAALAAGPAADAGPDRTLLVGRLEDAHALLAGHLGHEERDAMALVQAHLSPADWERVEKEHFQAAYGPRDLGFVLPWSQADLPAAAARRATALGGPPMRILLALTRGRFERREKAAFRYA